MIPVSSVLVAEEALSLFRKHFAPFYECDIYIQTGVDGVITIRVEAESPEVEQLIQGFVQSLEA